MDNAIKKWEKSKRLDRINQLSVPKQRPDVSILVRTLPAPVSKAALTGKVSGRISYLAKPKNTLANPENLYKPIITQAHFSLAKKKSGDEYNVSMRILDLSKPKKLLRNVHKKCLNTEQLETIYFRPAVTRNFNVDNFKKQQDWLKRNATPKKIFRPPVEPKKYSKMPIDQVNELIKRLSTLPKFKQKIPKKMERKIGSLTQTMLESVQRLSEPRKLTSGMRLNIEFNPYNIPLRVLNHVASQRTEELAAPKIHENKGLLNNIKENAFEISQAALNYKATKNIIKLATPRKR
ncbi:Testicular haploid expressed repeat [Cinara cedri]|uniref:Testicular haploid expressed repeat n=1 Tax=Cinara cedri TaxID=506608 RepID=A0A5E4MRK9_9HEMI|nr:Testicular haploid expressed repeat [Cinara cedri]